LNGLLIWEVEKENLKNRYEISSRVVQGIEQYIFILQSIDWIQETQSNIQSYHNKIIHNNKERETIETIIQKIRIYDITNHLVILAEDLKNNRRKLSTIVQLIPKLESIILINNTLTLKDQSQDLQYKIFGVGDRIKDLDSEYHLHICNHCDGVGVVPS